MADRDPADGEGGGDDEPGEASRRRFLKIATGCLGGGLGAALIVPAARLALGVAGRKTVTSTAEPIDAVAVEQVGDAPIAVTLRAASVRDAWATTRNVPLGVAFVRKDKGVIRALSSVCPHLGCTLGWDAAANRYLCPCHDTLFEVDGSFVSGEAKRAMDDLPVTIEGGRVKIQWVRYRSGGRTKEPV